MLLAVIGRTGDIVKMDIGSMVAGSSFDLSGVSISGGGSTLTKVVEGGTGALLWQDGGSNTVLRAVLSDRAEEAGDPFTSTGRVYIVPSIESSLVDDADAVSEGFQGSLDLTFDYVDGGPQSTTVTLDINAGVSGTGDSAITINPTVLDTMRIQHRLNFLGWRHSAAGDLLDITGSTTATDYVDVLEVLQAALDADGLDEPDDAVGSMDLHTATWLNQEASDFPAGIVGTRWEAYAGTVTSGSELYGTNWLIDTTSVGVAAEPSITVHSLSTIDGRGSAALHTGEPGREHQVGMEVLFNVPAAAQVGNNNSTLDIAEEQDIHDLVVAMKARADVLGIPVYQVNLQNQDVVDALHASYPASSRPAGFPDFAEVDASLSQTQMKVRLAAPTNSNEVAANETNAMMAIIRSLRELGEALEQKGNDALQFITDLEAVANSTLFSQIAPHGIPYATQGADKVIELGQSFEEIADGLLQPPAITAPVAPTGTIATSTPVLVSLQGVTPIRLPGKDPFTLSNSTLFEIDIPVPASSSAADYATAMNSAMATIAVNSQVNLDDLLQASDEGGQVSLAAIGSGIAEFLTLTTLRVEADNAGPAHGQPGTDVTFTVELESIGLQDDGTTGTIFTAMESVTLEEIATTSPSDPFGTVYTETQDNVFLSDLADDINAVFRETEVTATSTGGDTLASYLYALADGSHIVIAARDANTQRIKVTGASALGFNAAGEQELESSMAATSTIGLVGETVAAVPKFSTVPEFLEFLAMELGLPSVDDLNSLYDATSQTLYFDLEKTFAYEESVGLDFNDAIDLEFGIVDLGSLDFTAEAQADFQTQLDLDFRVGIDLNNLGSSFTLTSATPLTDLNAGIGIDKTVALTAANPLPSDGEPAVDSSFTLITNGATMHSILLPIGHPDYDDNFDPLGLVEDINSRLDAAGLGGMVEATAFINGANKHLTLRAVDSSITQIQVTSGANIGFTGSASESHHDLVFDLNGVITNVDLDDATTIGDVLTKINAVTNVSASIGNEKNLVIERTGGAGPLLVTQGDPYGLKSPAGLQLGILGTEDADQKIIGTPLHGVALLDRVFIVEPGTGEDNLTFTLDIDVPDLDLRAGLAFMELAVQQDPGNKFHFDAGLPLNLKDPGTSAADGRITVRELFDTEVTSLGSLIDITEAQSEFTANLGGTLTVSGDLLGSTVSGTLLTLDVSLDSANDLSSIQFEADGSGIEDLFAQLKDLNIQQVINALSEFFQELQSGAAEDFLDQEIPFVEQKIGDLLDFAAKAADAINSVVNGIDISELTTLVDQFDSAIANLPNTFEEKRNLRDAVATLKGVLQQQDVNFDNGPRPARVISAAAQAAKYVEDLTGGIAGNPLEQDLLDKIADLKKQVPTMNTLIDRLNDALKEHINDPFSLTAQLVDYDNDTTNGMQNALLLNAQFANSSLVSAAVDPMIPTDSFGPLELDFSTDLMFHAGATVDLGFGVRLDSLNPADVLDSSFIVVKDPDNTNAPSPAPTVLKTGVNVNAGFVGDGMIDVQFGGLDVVEAAALLSLSPAELEPDPGEGDLLVDASHQVVLVDGTPITEYDQESLDDKQEQLVYVYDITDDQRVPPEEFEVSGTTITFTSSPTNRVGHKVSVEYLTADPDPNVAGLDPENNVGDRASLALNFDDPSFSANALGAVAFSDLFGGSGPALQVTPNGMITGTLGVEFLNNKADHAISVAASLNHLDSWQFNVDSDALLSLFTNVEFDLRTIIAGLQKLLDFLEEKLTSEIAKNIPLVGDGLDTTGTFIGKFNNEVVEPFEDFLNSLGGTFEEVAESIDTFLTDKLGSSGIDILNSLNPDPVKVTLTADTFEIELDLGGSDTIAGVSFDSGLAGLPLNAEGGVEVKIDYAVPLHFGVNRTRGFYLVNSSANDTTSGEYSFTISAGLAVDTGGNAPNPTSVELDLFLLKMKATDILNGSLPGTKVSGSVYLDLDGTSECAGAKCKLYFDEIGGSVAVGFNLSADINLHLQALVDQNLPSVSADLVANWGVSGRSDGTIMVGTPTIALNNIGLDLGDFLSGTLGDAIEEVKEFIEPIQPVLDIITAEIPGVSDASKFAGNGPITFLDLAALYLDRETVDNVKKFIGVVDGIADFISMINSANGVGQVTIVFGSLSFGGADGTDSTGWQTSIDFDAPSNSSITNAINAFDSGGGVVQQIVSAGNSAMGSAMQMAEREPDTNGLGGLGIQLDFLEPENVMKFLMGQTADIITWDIPRFSIPFEWGTKIPVFPFPPISLGIGLNFEAFIDLSVGYDTRGIQTGDFLDGFFFGDLEDVTSGPDIDEFGFGMGVSLAALLDLGIASAGVEGEVRGDVGANWRDTDDNGKMYLDEISAIVQQDGVECLFDLEARISAIIRLVWEVLFASGKVDIIDVTLFEFNNEGLCPKALSAHVADGTSDGGKNSLPDGTVAPAGTLLVHAGHFANQRTSAATDVAESFTVTELAPGVMKVEGMGLSNSFAGVTSVFYDGGDQNDELTTLNVSVPVTAYGGDGADRLEGGSLDDVLDGGPGSDTLVGREGKDTLSGGGGNDNISGDEGDDVIDGGTDDDTITGGDGADQIDAGGGKDGVEGQGGADTIQGGPGSDQIWGGYSGTATGDPDAGDTIEGNAGNDSIVGGPGDDAIDGGSGDDVVTGDAGMDDIRGSDGNDDLRGNDDADVLDGGNGNDQLMGHDGGDQQFGGWGNDIIFANEPANPSTTFAEYIEGGPDDDFICGANGVDTIYGGTTDLKLNDIFADGGDDKMTPVTGGGFAPVSCDSAATYSAPGKVTIRGQKFQDTNGNGVQDPGEDGLNGWTIEVYDSNNDLVTTATTADNDLDLGGTIDAHTERGTFVIDDLDPGDYVIREVQQNQWKKTAPTSDGFSIFLNEGEASTLLQFGNQPLVRIHGTKWDDLDRDGHRDPDEPGVPNIFIYVDSNNNETYDGSEPLTITMSDDLQTAEDETGMYWLENVDPGTLVIREFLPPMLEQTYPGVGLVAYQQDFTFGAGAEWSTPFTTSSTPATGDKFLGEFGTGGTTLSLSGLPDHEFIQLEFDLYVIRSWDGSLTHDGVQFVGPDRFGVLVDGAPALDTTFSNRGGGVQSYPDAFGEGTHPARTGAAANNTLGYNFGVPMDAVYRVRLAVPHDADSVTFDFLANLVGAGIGEESWGIDNVTVTTDGDFHLVTVEPGGEVEGIDFGNSPPRADVHGQKFRDVNGNGVRDPGEVGIDGWKITLTDASGNVVQETTTMSMDLNLDGKINAERETGLFWIVGVPPGNYVLAEEQKAGWVPTTEPAVPLQLIEDRGYPIFVNFGNRPQRGAIHGTKYDDRNENGVRDPNEPGITDVVVYLDLNRNGVPDRHTAVMASTGTPEPIFAQSTLVSGFEVSGLPATVSDVNLSLNIQHPELDQLTIELVSPGGTRSRLLAGIAGADLVNTTFDDEAAESIRNGRPPFTGSFQPIAPLSVHDGEPADGIWTLQITDSRGFPADEAVLLDWTLEVQVEEPAVVTMPDDPRSPEDETGMYWFSGLVADDYVVREVIPAGQVQTQPGPAQNEAWNVHLAAGQTAELRDFGNAPERVPAEVVQHLVFYNNSSYDDFESIASPLDDNAIAPNKFALVAGQVASYANYTNYPLGLNGLMIDIQNLASSVLDSKDFAFRMGLNDDFQNWTMAPPPTAIDVRGGAGLDGSDRVTLIWPDRFLTNTWLELTVLPTANTGLPASNTVFWGNVVGETGTQPNQTFVNGVDFAGARDRAAAFPQADLLSDFDFDRNQIVAGEDLAIARDFVNNFLTAPRLIVPPAGPTPNKDGGIQPPPQLPGDVDGTKWADINGDGRIDDGEPHLEGFTIYADLNNNGVHDPGEPFDETDADGNYRISGMAPGDYVIREVQQDGWTQTFPSHRLLGVELRGGQQGGQLWDLSTATGRAMLPRNTQLNLVGIAEDVDNELLYGLTATGELGTIDIDTGVFSHVVSVGKDLGEGDIDFDPASGTLYGLYDFAGPSPTLFTIDIATGGLTDIGRIATEDPSAMAFDGAGKLWVIDPAGAAAAGQLLEIDKTDAAVRQRFPLRVEPLGVLAGMDFSPVDSQLYLVVQPAVGGPDSHLWTVDTTAASGGTMTPAGKTVNGTDWSGLEFVQADSHVVYIDAETGATGNFSNIRYCLLPDGDDEIYGLQDNDKIWGDNVVTDPLVISEGGEDTIYGQEGADQIRGQDKDDVLWGAGPDITSGDGADNIDGGDDVDTVRQTVDADQTLTNTMLTGQGPDTLVSIEDAILTGGSSGNQIDASAFTAGTTELIGLEGNDALIGSPSDDVLHGGANDDILAGNDGDDQLDGGADSDTLDGGLGADTYLFANAASTENDTATETGTDQDTFDFSASSIAVMVDMNIAAIAAHGLRSVTTTTAALFEHAVGSSDNDTLVGNANDNRLSGGEGKDDLMGMAGNDFLNGGAGNDTLAGGNDDDVYVFHDGPSTGTETDQVTESNVDPGIDTLDFADLDASNPVTVNLSTVTSQLATANNYVLETSDPSGLENVVGTPGDDSLTDNQLSNKLVGGDGNDSYHFVEAAGGQTGTVVEPWPAQGVDTLDFQLSTSGVNVDLAMTAPIGTNGLRTLNGDGPSLENVTGGSNIDAISGNSLDNVLLGGDGNDMLAGRNGDDLLDGQNGDDVLNGGNHDDTYRFPSATAAESDTVIETSMTGGVDRLDFSSVGAADLVNADLTAGTASHTNRNITLTNPQYFENVDGGPAPDTLVGNAAANTLNGNNGDDTLNGGDGSDLFIGGDGDDRYVFESTSVVDIDVIDEQAGGGTDLLDFTNLPGTDNVTVDLSQATNIAAHVNRSIKMVTGGNGVNVENVSGGAGDDVITGSNVVNTLVGGPGNDTLHGLGADDTLQGDAGNNELEGGAGDDTYLFQSGTVATDRLIEDSGAVSGGLAAGGGSDWLDFSALTTSVTFDLTNTGAQTVDATTIYLQDSACAVPPCPNADHFENIVGAPFAVNNLTGNAANNTLLGGLAADNLSGGAGDDLIDGRGGADGVAGGTGNDIVIGGNASVFDGNDMVSGGDGRDLLVGGEGQDTLQGDADGDILIHGRVDFGGADVYLVLGILLNEWTHSTKSYADRENAIVNLGVGTSAWQLTVDTTVLSDGDMETAIVGDVGTDLDLFFVGAGETSDVDTGAGEIQHTTATAVAPWTKIGRASCRERE